MLKFRRIWVFVCTKRREICVKTHKMLKFKANLGFLKEK